MKDVIWVAVASQTDAKIYQLIDAQELSLVIAFDNPEGALHDRELKTDKPGRSSSPNNSNRHSFSSHVTPSQKVVENFVREVADYVNTNGIQGAFSELYLVADASLLGKLRTMLDKQVLRKVTTTLPKNLSHLPPKELISKLSGEIAAGHAA